MAKIDIEKVIGVIALGNYLSGWNENKSYDDVQEYLRGLESCTDSDTDEVNVWEKFERDDPNEVADHISNLHGDVKDLLVDVLTEIKTGVTTLDEVLKKLKEI